MARLVRKEAKGPYELKNGTESTWICMCGLSDAAFLQRNAQKDSR